jgi:hypothetical protein
VGVAQQPARREGPEFGTKPPIGENDVFA